VCPREVGVQRRRRRGKHRLGLDVLDDETEGGEVRSVRSLSPKFC
jgi:hypothetical protein